jgi:hypothetical protein
MSSGIGRSARAFFLDQFQHQEVYFLVKRHEYGDLPMLNFHQQVPLTPPEAVAATILPVMAIGCAPQPVP